MHGRSDRAAPVAFAGEMHRAIPGAELILADGGHLFWFQAGNAQFIADVTAFLTAAGR